MIYVSHCTIKLMGVFNSWDNLRTCPAHSYQTMKMMRIFCAKFTEFF